MRINLLIFSLIFLLAGIAHAGVRTVPDDLKLVGEAQLKVLWFEIYNARLENPQGEFKSLDGRLMLTLTYKRNITKTKLLQETAKQWIKAGLQQSDYQIWLTELGNIWSDIRQEDSLAFYQDTTGAGHFFYNGDYAGSLNDSGFSRAFLAIWLAENSDYPELTRALTGR